MTHKDQWKMEVMFRDKGKLINRVSDTWYHAPRIGNMIPREVDAKGCAFLHACLAAADVAFEDAVGFDPFKQVRYTLYLNRHPHLSSVARRPLTREETG